MFIKQWKKPSWELKARFNDKKWWKKSPQQLNFMISLAIQSPLANCLVVTGCTSSTQGPAPTFAWSLNSTWELWWSHSGVGRNFQPLQAASVVWVVPSFSTKSARAHCTAGITGTGLHTELAAMPIHFNWTSCWKLAALPNNKALSSRRDFLVQPEAQV